MNKAWKIVLTVILICFLAGSFVFYKIWFKPHRSVLDEEGVAVTAQGIVEAYNANEKNANDLYLDKTIAVTGEVSDISKTLQGKTVLSLKTSDPMAAVRCTMKEDVQVHEGEKLKIKGICTGFLMDVTLIECYITDH